MQAVRVHHDTSSSAPPYSATNPAPSSALHLDSNVPIPTPTRPGELLIRVHATTVIRDELTWPETYLAALPILGHDFAGAVVAVYERDGEPSPFKVGDEVFGMTHAARGGTWAEYALVTVDEACLKPSRLTWAQAAAVPLSGLTAYQALFEKGGVAVPLSMKEAQGPAALSSPADGKPPSRLLLTGAAGGVGIYIVQLAKLAGVHVVAATSSNTRNRAFLEALGADEVVEYSELSQTPTRYELIIDTVGGQTLESCWELVAHDGALISVDSASFDFVERHQKAGLALGKESVKALFFIVRPSREDLARLSIALENGLLVPMVRSELPLADARLAYDLAAGKSAERGKIALIPSPGKKKSSL